MLLGIDGHFVDGEKHVRDAVLRAVGRQVAFKVAEVHHVHLVKACAEERTHGVAVGVLHHKQLAARGKVVVRDAHAAHIAVQVHGARRGY